MSLFNFLHRGKGSSSKSKLGSKRVFEVFETKESAQQKQKSKPTKHITIYKVFKTLPEFDEEGHIINASEFVPLYYTTTWEKAQRAADLLLYYEKIDHFTAWVECRKRNNKRTVEEDEYKDDAKGKEKEEDTSFEPSINSDEWKLYKQMCVTPEQEYYIAELCYTPEILAQQLRALLEITPLFTPDENPEEVYAYMLSTLDEKRETMSFPDNVNNAALKDPAVALNLEQTIENVAKFVNKYCKELGILGDITSDDFKLKKRKADGTIEDFSSNKSNKQNKEEDKENRDSIKKSKTKKGKKKEK
jgi:hypothetical protein